MTIYTENIPYTYYIAWTITGMKYYGVRYAKNCNPTDLLVEYFTSSKYVKDHILQYGNPDIVEIRKTFSGDNRIKEAQHWEHRVLKRMKVVHREDFLNKTDGKSISISSLGWARGLTKETNLSVASISKTLTGRTKETHAHLARLSEKRLGLTKETNAGLMKTSILFTGRSKETHPYIAENAIKISKTLTGRTKETHPYIEEQANKIKGRDLHASYWEIIFESGEKIIIRNLNQWCKLNNLNYSTIKATIRRKKKYNGITFVKLAIQLL